MGTGGKLTIVGNYTQTSTGTLAIDVNGPGPGIGFLDIQGGSAVLSGTLQVTRNPGYTPPALTTLTFMDYNTRGSTDFTQKNEPDQPLPATR